jgi:hypothetical protein
VTSASNFVLRHQNFVFQPQTTSRKDSLLIALTVDISNYFHIMTLAGSVAGFATLGFTVRAYALGIQKRPVLEGENE